MRVYTYSLSLSLSLSHTHTHTHIYSTINHWNDLNPEIRNSKTISSFRKVEMDKSYFSCRKRTKQFYYIKDMDIVP